MSATTRSTTRLAAALAVLAVALAASGCGLAGQRARGTVALLVTRDRGERVLLSSAEPAPTHPSRGLDVLAHSYPVEPGQGGSLAGIPGVAPAPTPGLPGQDASSLGWFLYLDGVQVPAGRAGPVVRGGEQVWWDLHEVALAPVKAVVGAFPEPFRDGIDGKRLPVRVECSSVGSAACRTVADRLGAAGVLVGLSQVSGGGGGPDTLRVLVGPAHALSVDRAAHLLLEGPPASGVYARPSADGTTIALLDTGGHPSRVLGAASGLIAATQGVGEAPTWLVTGTDQQGVQLAADEFAQTTLARRFAVALTKSGPLALALPLPLSVRSGHL